MFQDKNRNVKHNGNTENQEISEHFGQNLNILDSSLATSVLLYTVLLASHIEKMAKCKPII